VAPGGTLFVVATPLGHLGDLSARVTRLLKEVPVVAAEDTRRTRALLSHLQAHPRLIAYHAHAGRGAAAAVLAALRAGHDVALVTDAGTPGVSDPGPALVQEVRGAGFPVVPLPGPSAVATALSASGLPADRYVFLGFLPRKGGERTRLLERIGREEWTMVLFESPERIGDLVRDLAAACGPGRRAVLAREMTKVHEEFRAGTLAELADLLEDTPVLGECTLVLEGKGPPTNGVEAEEIRKAADRLLRAGLPRREVVALLADLFGASRNVAYRAVTGDREPVSGDR
jgi:16S rRNA (cytidine1402-2'-O)-methyltransferase